jgi:uncharacterized membrane protein YebE (DUF533 family)
MLAVSSEVPLSQDAAVYIARGLRALAGVDGLHPAELALVESFEQDLGLEPTSASQFQSQGGGPLTDSAQRELFVRSMFLMALADGRISAYEGAWIERVATEIGVPAERQRTLATDAKKFLLSSLAGVRAFRAQAMEVGRGLGLSEEDIAAVLG